MQEGLLRQGRRTFGERIEIRNQVSPLGLTLQPGEAHGRALGVGLRVIQPLVEFGKGPLAASLALQGS